MDKNMLKQFLQHFSNLLLTIFAKLTNTVPKLAQKFFSQLAKTCLEISP